MKLLIYIISIIALNTSIKAQNFTFSDTIFQKGEVWITHDIQFDYDKSVFRNESYIVLDSIYNFLLKNPSLHIEITNHCDERYSPKYSTCLTCNRAKAIEEYLREKGINPERLSSTGRNDNVPLIINAMTDEEHAMNRRTEIKITKME